ncbi:hypothetical protein [Anaerotignum lactatifermentans]|uniref:hypothetical protein n=1 Tax=Anaerotignum lactatifermentans TaxID=160404 RepID=UPI0026776518|nr:hypothetical protein [Anaerotignum lactatifermentans]
MLKSLFEYVVGLSKANVVTIDGTVYTDKPLHLPEMPTIETLRTDNLSSIVNFIKHAWDADLHDMDDTVQKIIHVEDAGKVNLYSSVCNECMDRQKFMTAEWAGNKFPFGQFMDAEKFNILLQTCFMETDDLKVIQQVVGNLRDEAVQNYGDDGVSQSVTIRTGIATVGQVRVPSPAKLRPYRTFLEVEQPASLFILRMREGGQCALFEADGGLWRETARQNIRNYFEYELEKMVSEHKVVIL